MFEPKREISLLDVPNGTELKIQVYKPHAGQVMVVAVTEEDEYKVLFQWDLFSKYLVERNEMFDDVRPMPKGWNERHATRRTGMPDIPNTKKVKFEKKHPTKQK